MAKPAKTEAPTAALPMPASGGAWLRQTDGSLIRDPAEHPPEAVETTVEPAVKEG